MGLGLGFVAAAVAVVMCTVLVRVFQVRRSATRARQNGEDVTFRDMWARWGGWWGMMFSHESPRAPRRFRLHVKHLPRPHLHDAVVGEQKEMFEDSEQVRLSWAMVRRYDVVYFACFVRMLIIHSLSQ